MPQLSSCYAVITTIQPPTVAVRELHRRLGEFQGRLVVAGDKKGRRSSHCPTAIF